MLEIWIGLGVWRPLHLPKARGLHWNIKLLSVKQTCISKFFHLLNPLRGKLPKIRRWMNMRICEPTSSYGRQHAPQWWKISYLMCIELWTESLVFTCEILASQFTLDHHKPRLSSLFMFLWLLRNCVSYRVFKDIRGVDAVFLSSSLAVNICRYWNEY